jgi:hypothetical protein
LARLAEAARPTLLGIRNAALRNLVEGARKAAQKGRVPNREEGGTAKPERYKEVEITAEHAKLLSISLPPPE